MRYPLITSTFVLLGLLAAGCRNQSGRIEPCNPGDLLTIGCTSTVGTMCTGDPTLTICDGASFTNAEDCRSTSPGFLRSDDDGGGGRCPLVRDLTCPASGRIAVNPNPFSGSSLSWSCRYAIVSMGGPTPTTSVETCRPGDMLDIGCTGMIGGTCSGDPTLSVCDAGATTPEACMTGATGFLGYNDDSSGLCPAVLGITCPASGRIAIAARPLRSGAAFTCAYAVQASPIRP